MKLVIFALLNGAVAALLGTVIAGRLGLHGTAAMLVNVGIVTGTAVCVAFLYPDDDREDLVFVLLARLFRR